MRKLTLGLALMLCLAAYIGCIKVAESLFSPPKSYAATPSLKPAKTTQPKMPDKPSKPKRKKGRHNLENGHALSEKEIRVILSRHRNGKYLMPYSKELSKACQRWDVNPLLAIGMFQVECQMGRLMQDLPNGQPSWNFGNLRRNSEDFRPARVGKVRYFRAGKNGRFAAFESPEAGINAYCWVLRTVYLDKGRDTLPEIIEVYAPSEDNNRPGVYTETVKAFLRQ